MEIHPSIPAGRCAIERYGPGGFKIAGTIYTGAVLVFPDQAIGWAPGTMAEITLDSLRPVAERGGVEILLLGCGKRLLPIARPLRDALRQAGIVTDTMDTAAACRTYNVLLAEDRRVAAALLPIGA
jgi:uncharacterized protein